MPITRFDADGLVRDESSLPSEQRSPMLDIPKPVDTTKVTPKLLVEDVASAQSISHKVQRATPMPITPHVDVEGSSTSVGLQDDSVKSPVGDTADDVSPVTITLGDSPRTVLSVPPINQSQSVPTNSKYLNKLVAMLCQLPDTIDVNNVISDILTDEDKDEMINLAPAGLRPKLVQILHINELRNLGWDDLDMDELINDRWTDAEKEETRIQYAHVMKHVINKLTTHELFLKHFIRKS